MIKTNVECKSADTSLGTFGTIAECAAACTSTNGCKYFIFGNKGSVKAGRCYHEKTNSRGCSEGWDSDSYTFYELKSESAQSTPQTGIMEKYGNTADHMDADDKEDVTEARLAFSAC